MHFLEWKYLNSIKISFKFIALLAAMSSQISKMHKVWVPGENA